MMKSISNLFSLLNSENKLISGACAGGSDYLASKGINIPAILFRLLFIFIACFVTALPTIIAYIVAGVVVSRLTIGRTSDVDDETRTDTTETL